MKNASTVLITGAAGFIGFHLARHYHNAGFHVIGADDLDDLLECDIRRRRAEILCQEGVIIKSGNLTVQNFSEEILSHYQPDFVFHMAASTNVRCRDAQKFADNNITAFNNILSTACRYPPKHLLFASSSSVYGENSPRPFCENTPLVIPDNSYAASKLIGEHIARFWAMSVNFPITGIRFFNVYGPWGRPDMAPFYFTDCLWHEREIIMITDDAYRAWLYIEDAVDACIQIAKKQNCHAPYVVNVSGPQLVQTSEVLAMIAWRLNKTPHLIHRPPKFPEITSNPADMRRLKSLIGRTPQTIFADGITKFLDWYSYEWANQQEKMI